MEDLCKELPGEHNRRYSKWYNFVQENDSDWWNLNIGSTGIGKSNNNACLCLAVCGREALNLKNWSWNAKELLNSLSDPNSICNIMDEGSEAFFTREGMDRGQIDNLKMAVTNRAFNKFVSVNSPKIELLTGTIRDWFHSITISYHKRFKGTLILDKGYMDIYARDSIPKIVSLLQDMKKDEEYLQKRISSEEKIKIIQNKIVPSFSLKFPSLKTSHVTAFSDFWKKYYDTKLKHIEMKTEERKQVEDWGKINNEYKKMRIEQFKMRKKQKGLNEPKEEMKNGSE